MMIVLDCGPMLDCTGSLQAVPTAGAGRTFTAGRPHNAGVPLMRLRITAYGDLTRSRTDGARAASLTANH